MRERADELFESGKVALAEGRIGDALKHLSMSLSFFPRPEAYIYKAQAEIKRDDLKKALSEVDNGLKACERDAEASAQVALQLKKMKDKLSATIEEKAQRARADALKINQHKAGGDKSATLKQFTDAHERSSVRLLVNPDKPGELTGSRIGGAPAVPPGFVWPASRDNRPLQFLCQLSLPGLKDYGCASLLPAVGLLSFFYDVDNLSTGTEKDGWRVFHFADDSSLTAFAGGAGSEIKAAKIEYKEEKSYPDPLADELYNALKDGEKYDEFAEAVYELPPHHRLLGHPQLIQGDWREEAECDFNNVKKPRDIEGLKRLYDASRDWQLLLQLDSDEYCRMFWGDGGYLYFCIKEADLRSGNFNNIVVEMQST